MKIKNSIGVNDTIIACKDSQLPLSIQIRPNSQKIKIFPVPCSSTFFIQVPEIEKYHVSLLSANGKVVKDFGKQGSNSFNISNVPCGNYIICMEKEKKILVEKHIIMD